MRPHSILTFCVLSVALWACHNLEDAPPSNRSTFLKIYEGPYSITATDLEVISDGFVVLGNMEVNTDSIVGVIFKTDKQGTRTTDWVYLPGGTAKSFKQFTSPFNGYIIVGDSIKSDPSSPLVANIDVASARIIILDENFMELGSRTQKDTTVSDNNPFIADYYSGSVTVAEDGRIFILGTYREGVVNQLQVPLKPYVLGITPNLTRDWLRKYDLINRNYNNSRSIHFFNDKIFWASSIERIQSDLTFSYVSIPVVQNESVFINYSQLGEATDQLFKPSDIQPANDPNFGFGVVGTYSLATDGSQGNIFFIRTDMNGTIIPSSARYFDGIASADGTAVTSDVSQIVDAGESITSTSDGGFVLAGTYESNPELGKGLKDIILIKLNGAGDTVWTKTFGGEGNEEVASITETSDRGLLVCGTSTIGTYSTPILIKMDKNGELKN
jgi:hypothetical protein